MMLKRVKPDLWIEIARFLGGSDRARAFSEDPGLLGALLPLGGRGLGDWCASMPSRFDDFASFLGKLLLPGHPELLKVRFLAEHSLRRMTVAVELVRGFRLSSPDGRRVQLPRGVSGVLAHGKPDPGEDLEDLAAGLRVGQVAVFTEPAKLHGVLLAARPTPGSVWFPLAPRTGPRPKRTNKPAGQ